MKRPGCTSFVLFALVALLAIGRPAPAEEAAAGPRTGTYTTQFTEKSPHSDPGRIAERMHLRPGTKVPGYDLADHTFQLVVPESYDGSEDYGLLVFIHPNNDVELDRFYAKTIKELLAKHKLIWVSFSGGGNPVMSNIRLSLTLDAAHNAMKLYRIDEERVYVSGLSGGGRMTCMAGVYYPDLFTGCIPIVGSLFYRDMKMPEDEELRALIRPKNLERGVWYQALIEPKRARLKKMKAEQRWVLLAGEKDFNMPEMRAHYKDGFKQDGFEHAHYLEVPGMGHRYPEPQWYEKAIRLLDEPLGRHDPDHTEPADERTQRLAQKRLDVALRALERDRDRGIAALEQLVAELPNTEAAAAARAKLAELSSGKAD